VANIFAAYVRRFEAGNLHPASRLVRGQPHFLGAAQHVVHGARHCRRGVGCDASHSIWSSNFPTVIASSTEKARDVALALIPEAIASSIIAGVDPKVGLYASFSIAVIIIDFTGGRSGMISAATGDGAGDGVFAAALVAPWLFLVIAPISVLYIPAARDDDQAREHAATLDSQCRRRWETDMCSAGSAARMACTHRKGREPSCPCGTVGAGDLSDAGAKPGVAYGGVAVQKYPSGRSRPT
jgi:hypothetical protein